MSNVRHLQRTLYLKSKQEKDARFYSLYDKIYREDVLQEAWHQVKANRGAPGVDGERIDEIVAQGREQEMIDRLEAALRGHSYGFSPVRGVEIPKPKGGTRTLGIATVGTVFSAMAINTRAREVMLPLLFLPVIVPLIIAVVEATGLMLRDGDLGDVRHLARQDGKLQLLAALKSATSADPAEADLDVSVIASFRSYGHDGL